MKKLELQEKQNKIFAPLKNKWLVKTPEEKIRQEYILELVNKYGYSLEQMAQEVKVSNSSRGQGRAYADIVIWKNKEDKLENKKAFIVVECKAENIKIKKEDYFQGMNYASWAGASFLVTTNEKEIKFFNVDNEYLPKKLNEIVAIPKSNEINDKKRIEEYLNATRNFQGDEFAKLLFRCHNIIRNNDRLSPEAAFDEIAKILFMKIMYERDKKHKGEIFSREAFKEAEQKVLEAFEVTNKKMDKPFYQYLFDQTKIRFKNDDLFNENEDIRIKEISFMEIVQLLEKYNLSDTSDDIKGIAFEEFLGKTFRGELGQYFTPRPIVDFIIEILDPCEGELICDPCAGSGGFLITAFEKVRSKIELDIQAKKMKLLEQYSNLSEEEYGEKANYINKELNKELSPSKDYKILENGQEKETRIYNLSRKSVFGTDANPRMARTSKMNMIMHGDGHSGVHHNDGLLNVNGIFEDRFDVILTNPPFGNNINKNLKITVEDKYKDKAKIKAYKKEYGKAYEKALRQITDNIGNPLLDLYEIGKFTGKTEALFMERCLNLLRPGGRMGIVLPDGVLNNGKEMEKVREYCEGKAKIVLIVSIPQDVFIASGATVKSSLIFLKKFTIQEKEEFEKVKETVQTKILKEYENFIKIEKKYLNNKETELKELRKEVTNLKKSNVSEIILNEKTVELVKVTEEIKIIRKDTKKKIKTLENERDLKIRKKIKEGFNYMIPIAEVSDGGINTVGMRTENKELKQLAQEFKKYRKTNKLWETKILNYDYKIKDKKIERTLIKEVK
jgi:type I restriction enzyme M protein